MDTMTVIDGRKYVPIPSIPADASPQEEIEWLKAAVSASPNGNLANLMNKQLVQWYELRVGYGLNTDIYASLALETELTDNLKSENETLRKDIETHKKVLNDTMSQLLECGNALRDIRMLAFNCWMSDEPIDIDEMKNLLKGVLH